MDKIPFLQATQGQLYIPPIRKGYSEGYYQASAQQGMPTTNPVFLGFLNTEDMEAADKFASASSSINPYAVSSTSAIGKVNPTDSSMIARKQNESRELENCDVSGSYLGEKLDLQGAENKAWGKKFELT